MPYIDQEARKHFDYYIDKLADLVEKRGSSVGELNYIISRIIWVLWGKKPSYTSGNNLIGVLECVKAEFYRRLLAPYEDTKIKDNGDL